MTEQEIRDEIESRRHDIHASIDWYTPAGNRRNAPLFVATVENEYLSKRRELKASSEYELNARIQECIGKWNEQEIRKRTVEAKRDAKEQGQAEAERLDSEAKALLEDLNAILHATLSVDDKIDWDAEMDRRGFYPFVFHAAPEPPPPLEPILPAYPGWTWLFRSRKAKWEQACDEARARHAKFEEERRQAWQAQVDAHTLALNTAKAEHDSARAEFKKQQAAYNEAIAAFRQRFEAGDIDAITEYCSRVFERSQYPDVVELRTNVAFDSEAGYVIVDMDLPPKDALPIEAGYKFVSKGNQAKAIALKKKEIDELYESVLDQVALRTIHEVVESCYISKVQGVLFNGWVTETNKATGIDERKAVRCISTDRASFEALDLARLDPSACVEKLSSGTNQMRGSVR